MTLVRSAPQTWLPKLRRRQERRVFQDQTYGGKHGGCSLQKS